MPAIKKLTTVAAAATLALAFAISPASAQGTAEERSACMGDAFQFCSAAIPDVDKVTACLKENLPRLSPACQGEFQQGGRTKIKSNHFNR